MLPEGIVDGPYVAQTAEDGLVAQWVREDAAGELQTVAEGVHHYNGQWYRATIDGRLEPISLAPPQLATSTSRVSGMASMPAYWQRRFAVTAM